MKNYVFGAGGHGKVVFDILHEAGVNVSGFVDSNPSRPTHFGLEILAESKLPRDVAFGLVIAVGANQIRAALAKRLFETFPKIVFINAVHPSALVAKSAKLGVGNVIAAGAIVGADSTIGDHCVINTGSQVDHDSKLANFVSFAPGVVAGGGVSVGEMSYVALGSSIIHGISIGSQSVIGAGAVVVRPVGNNVVAFGNPCRVVRSRKDDDKYL